VKSLAVPPQPHGPLAQPAGAMVTVSPPLTPRHAGTYEDARRLIRMGHTARARAMLASAAAAGGEGAALLAAWAEGGDVGGGR
jgi:hypothetical protein